LLTGEFRNMIDDKGRLLIPSRLRNALAHTDLHVCRSPEDNCLWLMLAEDFEEFANSLTGGAWTMFDKKSQWFRRSIIARSAEIEIDKAGRINIPLSLREPVGLPNKQEAMLLGTNKVIEIWNESEYNKYLEAAAPEVPEYTRQMSEQLFELEKK